MTPAFAPYAPPSAALLSESTGISIEGSKLVVPDGYIFPPICPYTGEVTGLGMAANRRVSAHDVWVYFLLLLGLIPYVIVAIMTTRRATFNCRLSDRVTRRWRYFRITGQLLFFGSFFVGFKGLFGQNIGMVGLAIVMLVGGFCTACGLFDGIRASAVKNGKIWLSGMPRKVRENVVEIERRRMEALQRAAQAQAAGAHGQSQVQPLLPMPVGPS